jgi:tripartite-type tricarboxylate transporter receptor subunit TctC
MAGITLNHVAYKGSAPAITDLIAGQVQLSFGGIPAVLPHVNQGRLRAIAVTGLTRSAQLPAIPTVSESGVKGYEVNPWYGMLAPAGTPRDIVDILHAQCQKILRSSAMKEHLTRQGADPDGAPPAAFADVLRADIARWSQFIKQNRIVAE